VQGLVLRQMTHIGDDAARTAVFPVQRRDVRTGLPPAGRSGYQGAGSCWRNGPPGRHWLENRAGAAFAGRPARAGTAWPALTWPALTMAEITRPGSPGGPTGPRAAKRQERAERLAAALKDNLRRRKAQARERAAEAGQPGQNPGQDPGPHQEPAEGLVNKKLTDKADPGQGS
jgi:hypothetical protein